MTIDQQLGGGFAEVRDGARIDPVIRPEPRVASGIPARVAHRQNGLAVVAAAGGCQVHPCACRGCDEFDCGLDACACCWTYDDNDELQFDPDHPSEDKVAAYGLVAGARKIGKTGAAASMRLAGHSWPDIAAAHGYPAARAAYTALGAAADSTDDPDPADDVEPMTSTVVVALPVAGSSVYDVAAEGQDVHATVLWFGEATDEAADAIRANVAQVAADLSDPELGATATTVERLGDDEPQALVLLLDPESAPSGTARLVDVHEELLNDGTTRAAWEATKQWPTYTPHVTLGYPATDEDAAALEDAAGGVAEVRFDRLAVWQGDRQDEYPIGAPVPDPEPAEPPADSQEDAVTAAAPEVEAPPTDAPGTEGTDAQTATDLTWEGVLVAEGITTGDKRKIRSGALTWLAQPAVLKAMFSDKMGHDDSVPVGLILAIERREDGKLWGTGTWDTGELAVEARRQNIAGLLRGVSIDMDDMEISFETEAGEPIEGDELFDLPIDEEPVLVIDQARIRAATLWCMPAFVEAYVLDSTVADQVPDLTVLGGTGDNPSPLGLAAAGAYAESNTMAGRRGIAPAAAFANPGLTEPTPLTITEDGRVFGHIATWGTCHIGIEGACVTPPTSETDYAYFLTGMYATSDGDAVPVGTLTMGTGHADLKLGWRPTVDHYDDTGTAAAYLNVGQDDVGIWMAGVLDEDLPDAQRLALMRAGSVSGDWRGIGGNLELVAALGVNVPGFPIPRVKSRVAGGARALVASGVVRHAELENLGGIDYGRLAREVAAYQSRAARHADAARQFRKLKQGRLAGMIRKG